MLYVGLWRIQESQFATACIRSSSKLHGIFIRAEEGAGSSSGIVAFEQVCTDALEDLTASFSVAVCRRFRGTEDLAKTVQEPPDVCPAVQEGGGDGFMRLLPIFYFRCYRANRRLYSEALGQGPRITVSTT